MIKKADKKAPTTEIPTDNAQASDNAPAENMPKPPAKTEKKPDENLDGDYPDTADLFD